MYMTGWPSLQLLALSCQKSDMHLHERNAMCGLPRLNPRCECIPSIYIIESPAQCLGADRLSIGLGFVCHRWILAGGSI